MYEKEVQPLPLFKSNYQLIEMMVESLLIRMCLDTMICNRRPVRPSNSSMILDQRRRGPEPSDLLCQSPRTWGLLLVSFNFISSPPDPTGSSSSKLGSQGYHRRPLSVFLSYFKINFTTPLHFVCGCWWWLYSSNVSYFLSSSPEPRTV